VLAASKHIHAQADADSYTCSAARNPPPRCTVSTHVDWPADHLDAVWHWPQCDSDGCVPAESSPTLRPTYLEARGAAELEGQGLEQRRIIFFEQLDRGRTSTSAIPSSVIRPEGKRWGVAAEGRAGCRGRTRRKREPADPLDEWTDAEMWEKEACCRAMWWMAHCTARDDGARGIRGSSWMGGGLDGRCKRGVLF